MSCLLASISLNVHIPPYCCFLIFCDCFWVVIIPFFCCVDVKLLAHLPTGAYMMLPYHVCRCIQFWQAQGIQIQSDLQFCRICYTFCITGLYSAIFDDVSRTRSCCRLWSFAAAMSHSVSDFDRLLLSQWLVLWQSTSASFILWEVFHGILCFPTV